MHMEARAHFSASTQQGKKPVVVHHNLGKERRLGSMHALASSLRLIRSSRIVSLNHDPADMNFPFDADIGIRDAVDHHVVTKKGCTVPHTSAGRVDGTDMT